MKNCKTLFFIALIFSPLIALCSTSNVQQTLMNTYADFSAVVATVVVLSSIVNNLLNTSGFRKQAVSWIIALIVTLTGMFLKFNLFAEMAWHQVLIYAIGIALVSNGVFDIPTVKRLLQIAGIEARKTGLNP
jgi:hypothetical protein